MSQPTPRAVGSMLAAVWHSLAQPWPRMTLEFALEVLDEIDAIVGAWPS
jgi:hypothetical protein